MSFYTKENEYIKHNKKGNEIKLNFYDVTPTSKQILFEYLYRLLFRFSVKTKKKNI